MTKIMILTSRSSTCGKAFKILLCQIFLAAFKVGGRMSIRETNISLEIKSNQITFSVILSIHTYMIRGYVLFWNHEQHILAYSYEI